MEPMEAPLPAGMAGHLPAATEATTPEEVWAEVCRGACVGRASPPPG
jgi:hypothetical protein